MNPKKLVVRLKGGLGNQMFQYAAARALALKKGMKLRLDITSGFVRDRVYNRAYSLQSFPLAADFANTAQQLPFWYERARSKCIPSAPKFVQRRPWGLYVNETHFRYAEAIEDIQSTRNVFMEGYWQSERYFADCRDLLQKEFALPAPADDLFLSAAKEIEGCNSVSVGVRRFEELPGAGKQGVGGLVPYSFYEEAARHIARRMNKPKFFVFCTREDGVRGKLRLPGETRYLTSDNGYADEPKVLWLMSRCANHIISNSSFYWWGAWLSEARHDDGIIIGCTQFTNSDCIPARWSTLPAGASN